MSPGCLMFFLEGRRWMADIRRFERLFAAMAANPPRPRARAEVTPAYLPAKNAPGPLTTATRRSTHRGEVDEQYGE